MYLGHFELSFRILYKKYFINFPFTEFYLFCYLCLKNVAESPWMCTSVLVLINDCVSGIIHVALVRAHICTISFSNIYTNIWIL